MNTLSVNLIHLYLYIKYMRLVILFVNLRYSLFYFYFTTLLALIFTNCMSVLKNIRHLCFRCNKLVMILLKKSTGYFCSWHHSRRIRIRKRHFIPVRNNSLQSQAAASAIAYAGTTNIDLQETILYVFSMTNHPFLVFYLHLAFILTINDKMFIILA